jgi:shikimate kinase
MKLLGEPKWRELEAAIAADFLKTEEDCVFDLGGSQPLNPTVQKVCKEVGIAFVYLKADHETICAHLDQEQNDGRPKWQHISNYQAAGIEGWRLLALNHRNERESLLEALADLTIDVTNSSIEDVNLKVRMAIAQYELQLQDEDKMEVELEEIVPIVYSKMEPGESSQGKPQQEVQIQSQLNRRSPTKHF